MVSSIEVIGVYATEAGAHVHLIEVVARNVRARFNISEFTQEASGIPPSDWQVAYDDKILDAAGEGIVSDGFDAANRPELWHGDVRIAFFFHYLDFSKPLKTPLGNVALPQESPKPDRLSVLSYEPPG